MYLLCGQHVLLALDTTETYRSAKSSSSKFSGSVMMSVEDAMVHAQPIAQATVQGRKKVKEAKSIKKKKRTIKLRDACSMGHVRTVCD